MPAAAYIKGVAGVLLMLVLGGAALLAWGQVTATPAPAVKGDSGYGIAWSMTEAIKTNLWINFEPGRPGSNANDEILLQYRVESPSNTEVELGYAFAGPAVGLLATCRDQAWDVSSGVAFNDLPQVAREAAVKAVATQQSDSDAPDASTSAAEMAADDRFTLITTRVSAVPEEAEDGSGTIMQAEGFVYCDGDLSRMWTESNAGSRLTTVPVTYAAPSTSTNELYGSNIVEVPTDDSFYFQRGSLEPELSTTGLSTWTIDSAPLDIVNQYDLLAQDGVSALFSGYTTEVESQSWSLLAGVLLGVVASIAVSLLSGLVDLLLKYFGKA